MFWHPSPAASASPLTRFPDPRVCRLGPFAACRRPVQVLFTGVQAAVHRVLVVCHWVSAQLPPHPAAVDQEDVSRDNQHLPAMEKAKMGGKATDSCQCYINTAEIRRDDGLKDPIECLRRCKAQFLGSALESWGDSSGWDDGCRELNGSVPVRDFWALYWCDSTFCGVGINQAGGLGQDRE